MDPWTCFVEDNDGVLPDNAFQLINYSRTTDKIETLSYNKALIIFEKQRMDKNKKSKTNKKKKKKKNNKLISLSVTDPTSPEDKPSALSINHNDDSLPNYKHNKKDSKLSKKSKSLTSSPVSPGSDTNFDINDHVLLNKDREGLIRFIGDVHFTKGILYGIELLNGSIGKHDGCIDNERYFQTDPNRGIFVKKKQIRRKMRAKDYRTSLKLRRNDSIEAMETKQKRSDSVNKMIKSDNIKMVHGDIDQHQNGMFKTVNTMKANNIKEPQSIKGKEYKDHQRQKRKRENNNNSHHHHQRRSSSAKRAGNNKKKGTVKTNLDKINKLKSRKIKSSKNEKSRKSIDDNAIFNKIMDKNIYNIDDDDDEDNSDWDDNDDDDEQKGKRRVNTIDSTSKHNKNSFETKLKRKRQSVDDMIIDDYFGGKTDKNSDSSITSLNRVHSRIPDYRHRKNAEATNNKIPASFKQFQQSQKGGRSRTIVGDKGVLLQKRRSREHLFNHYGHKKHAKHKSVHITKTNNDDDDDDDDLKQEIGRRSSLDLEPKYKKHTRGAKSAYSMKAIQSQPVNAVNDDDVKDKHSRFASVTNALSKGWNFAKNKNKNKNNKNKKNKKNAIFGIDPLTLNSTLLFETDYVSPIPNILIKLREELFINDGHLIEGIFRIAPNATECKRIEDELNDGKFLMINFSEIDCILIANLIKIWFRQLPQPILQTIDSSKIEKVQQTQNIDDVECVINNDLMEPYKSYFKWLLDLCVDITKHQNVNKMSEKNMAVVVAPNLYDPTKIENPMKAMTVSAAIVHFLQLSVEWRKDNKTMQIN